MRGAAGWNPKVRESLADSPNDRRGTAREFDRVPIEPGARLTCKQRRIIDETHASSILNAPSRNEKLFHERSTRGLRTRRTLLRLEGLERGRERESTINPGCEDVKKEKKKKKQIESNSLKVRFFMNG